MFTKQTFKNVSIRFVIDRLCEAVSIRRDVTEVLELNYTLSRISDIKDQNIVHGDDVDHPAVSKSVVNDVKFRF